MAGPYLAIALLVGCSLARVMNLLQLGDDLAVSLGVSLWRSRVIIGALAALLAASAVSIAGLVGFVGLIVPHGARLLVGTDYRWVLPQAIPPGLTVRQLVSLGRAPHQPWWRWELNAEDRKQVTLALESTQLMSYSAIAPSSSFLAVNASGHFSP